MVRLHNRKEIAQRFADAIKSKYIKQIILFGFVARGDDTENSDIDILIISDEYDKIKDFVADGVIKVIFDDEEYISAQIMNTAHYNKTKNFSFLTNVQKEGVILG